MKKRVLIIFFILLALLGVGIVFSIPEAQTVATVRPLDAEKLWSEVNNWRKESGLSEYQKSGGLCAIAEKRVVEVQSVYEHNKFEADYAEYPSRISENLNKRNILLASEKEVLQGWIDSLPHKKALEKPYIYSCIATKDNFAVQIFSSCENGCP